MNRCGAWFLAIRPKTLGISIAPVLVGSTLARAEYQEWSLTILFFTLCTALMIQVGTNLYNDAIDFERGTDTSDRLGPRRATAEGWLGSDEVKRASHFCFQCALAGGIYLTWTGGWPILITGILSIAAGYAYTGGPRPISHSPTGEIFVFVFFGLAAVVGSYYLQSGHVSPDSIYLGIAMGAFASAVMLVNNYRDLDTDRRSGKFTLVHYLGRYSSRRLYVTLVLSPFLLPLMIRGGESWPVIIALPIALFLAYRFGQKPPGAAYNRLLASTAQLQLLYAVLLSVSLML